jgi:hypothetical protein
MLADLASRDARSGMPSMDVSLELKGRRLIQPPLGEQPAAVGGRGEMAAGT